MKDGLAMKKLLATALTAVSPLLAMAALYDAHTDFSVASNPNGVWSYGYSTTLGGTFTPFDLWTGGSYDRWFTSIDALGVYDTDSGIFQGSVSVPANQLWLHPGPNGQYAVLRFTTPTTGSYNLAAGFFGVDFQGPTTTDVNIFLNNSIIFSDKVSTFATSPTTSFAFPLALTAGDTIDVAVGTQGNGYFFDSTAVNLSIETVPEPASLLVLGGLVALARRRKS